MKIFRRLLIVSVLALSACATMGDHFMDIHPGMSKDEVTQLLGQPEDRSFNGSREDWSYSQPNYATGETRHKVVSFENDKVTGMRNDDTAAERDFEIRKAKAGATKINVGFGQGGGNHDDGPLPCAGSNVFGAYAAGGGCNTFGCFPPGGLCNPFGCVSAGECSAVSCPNKIPSYQCAR